MKSKREVIGRLLILMSGLASCGSDNIETVIHNPDSQNPPPLELEVVHENQSFNRLKDLTSVPVTSALEFHGLKTREEYNIDSQVDCTASHLQETLRSAFVIPIKPGVEIKDLLPSQIFKPWHSPVRVVCDFKLELQNQHKTIAKINLNQLEVLGVDDLQDWSIPELSGDELKYFSLTAIKHIKIPLPFAAAIYELSCERGRQLMPLREGAFLDNRVFDPEIFSHKKLQKCRLIGKSAQTNHKAVSRAFFIQAGFPKIDLSAKYHLSGEHQGDYKNSIEVIVRNTGDLAAAITIQRPPIQMTTQLIHFANRDKYYFQQKSYPFQLTSQVHSLQTVTSNKEGDRILLSPQQEFRISYSAPPGTGFHCLPEPKALPQISPHSSLSSRRCHMTHHHVGNLHHIKGTFEISWNDFESEHSQHQKRRGIRFDDHLWRPSHSLNKRCSHLTAPQMAPTITVKRQVFPATCQ